MQDLTVVLGMFNGMLQDPFSMDPAAAYQELVRINAFNNWTDNNRAKDFLLRGSYGLGDLSLDLNVYLGMPVNAGDPDENDLVLMIGPGAEYKHGKFHIMGEFMFRSIFFGADVATTTFTPPVSKAYSMGLWAHFGYRLTDLIEIIARVDWIEPDLDDDTNDMLMRITAGMHLWIEGDHFRVLANLYTDIPLEDFGNRDTALGLQIQAAVLW
jgi:hypothetical protein